MNQVKRALSVLAVLFLGGLAGHHALGAVDHPLEPLSTQEIRASVIA